MNIMLRYTRNLFVYSVAMGIKALANGKFTKEVFKRILCPMDPSRYYEFPATLKAISGYIKPNSRILDISSPKLLTYYLANKYQQANFVSSDIQPKELDSWKKAFGELKNMKLIRADARKLKFQNNSFDLVFSISVIEHVVDDKRKRALGDMEFVSEVGRVLKKGGIFLFTTNVADKADLLYKNNDIYGINDVNSKNFFSRVYSKDSLYKRIIIPSRLKLMYSEVCKYRLPFLESIFNLLVPYSAIFGFLNILIFPFILNVKPTESTRFGKRADVLYVLKK